MITIEKHLIYLAILIHNNSFTRISSIIEANAIRIDLEYDAKSKYILSQHMPCAGVQISNNTFTQNIACYDSVTNIRAYCYYDNEIYENTLNFSDYGVPADLDFESITTEIRENYLNFSISNITTLDYSKIDMDYNKFVIQYNQHTENYASQKTGLITLFNIDSVTIIGENFTNNKGQYLEKLEEISGLGSASFNSQGSNGAISFGNYFYLFQGVVLLPQGESRHVYPGPPIVIRGSIIVNIQSLLFDNNYKQETGEFVGGEPIEQSQTITFSK